MDYLINVHLFSSLCERKSKCVFLNNVCVFESNFLHAYINYKVVTVTWILMNHLLDKLTRLLMKSFHESLEVGSDLTLSLNETWP